MITLYPGWCMVLWIISTCLLYIFLCDENIFLVFIFSCTTILFILLFVVNFDNFYIYKEHEPVEISAPYNNTIKVETIKIVEKRKRNLFTGKWGADSTASVEEKTFILAIKTKVIIIKIIKCIVFFLFIV